jgi:EpsD family peptidyl-prolyl cis-trans isomerase
LADDVASSGIARRVIGALSRVGHVTAIACALVLGLVPMQASAQAEPPAPSVPIAIIGSSVILETEIDKIAAGRPSTYADLAAEDRRERIIDAVVAEYVIDYFYGRDLTQLSPLVLDALNDARRQVLLQFYAQSKFTPPEVTETDIADFIARNPALFAGRYSYSFAVVTLSGGTEQARQALQDQVQDIAGQPTGQIAALDGLVAEAQTGGVIASVSTLWQPSEALPEDVLSRLDAMVLDGSRIHITAEPEAVSILLLNSAVPIPANPALLRDQIEQRLIADAFEVHREDLVRSVALTVLDPSAARTAARKANQAPGAELTVALPARGEVVWSSRPAVPPTLQLAALFSAGLFGTLAGYLLWTWLLLVFAQHRHILASDLAAPFLKKRSTAVGVTVLTALGLLGSAGAVVPIAVQTLGQDTSIWALSGGLMTAAAIAAILHFLRLRAFNRAVAEEMRMDYESIKTARAILLRNRKSVTLLAVVAAFVILYSMSLGLLLDGPPGRP